MKLQNGNKCFFFIECIVHVNSIGEIPCLLFLGTLIANKKIMLNVKLFWEQAKRFLVNISINYYLKHLFWVVICLFHCLTLFYSLYIRMRRTWILSHIHIHYSTIDNSFMNDPESTLFRYSDVTKNCLQ